MNELEILKVVHSERKPNWGGEKNYTYKDLLRDLGCNEGYLAESEISTLLHGKSRAGGTKFLDRISGPGEQQRDRRQNVERSLKLVGLFDCASRAEVVELIRRSDGAPPDAPRIAFGGASPEDDFDLTDVENRAIAYLAEQLAAPKSSILHWDTPFNSGASIVAQNLWTVPAIKEAYSDVAALRPSSMELPFEAEISALKDRLEANRQPVNSRNALANALCAERILLVLLSPFVLDSVKDSNSMRQLLKEFAVRRAYWAEPTRILIVGNCDWASRLLHGKLEAKSENRETLSDRMWHILHYQGEHRFVEFRRQWGRFSKVRGHIRSEESGSRMRRAATYYASHKTDLWPISIRLRALFACNESTAAYFDPTQGFTRLAGPQFRGFADVMSYYEDVTDYINYIRFNELERESRPRKGSLRYYLMQYVSTTKHWLTEDALEALLPEIRGLRYDLRLETEKGKMLDLRPVVEEKIEVVDGRRRSRYFASMAIKALIQDDWKRSDPYTRSVAHHRTAQRLKENENDKQALVWEFPYGPHWGRSRIFFLSETIRHLVRSSETFKGESASSLDGTVSEFPDPPERVNLGTDPSQVINYCYEVLYQRELNGGTRGVGGRALAKRYGAYQLAVELLQLMSADYVIGVPHPQLKAERRAEFMRDCGFALLDIGELPRAKSCFASAERELEDPGRRLERVNAILDSTLVDSASGNTPDATVSLERARKEIAELHSEYVRDGVSSAGFRVLRELYRRFLTREAHLAYLTGRTELALDLLDKIKRPERWPREKADAPFPREMLVPSFERRLEAEQTHLMVAALQKNDSPDNRRVEGSSSSIALNECLEAMLLAHSEGLNHQAMGFRIALARCFRRRGMIATAETLLDAVHLDLLRYGCSERTFLSFLNEAGRVLRAREDPIRAYATYLYPCIGRATAHGFLREAAQAAAEAIKCLRDIRRLCEEITAAVGAEDDCWGAALEEAKSNHRELITGVEDVPQDDLFGRDPLFAYAIADALSVIDELGSCEDIDRHIADLEKEFHTLSQ